MKYTDCAASYAQREVHFVHMTTFSIEHEKVSNHNALIRRYELGRYQNKKDKYTLPSRGSLKDLYRFKFKITSFGGPFVLLFISKESL